MAKPLIGVTMIQSPVPPNDCSAS